MKKSKLSLTLLGIAGIAAGCAGLQTDVPGPGTETVLLRPGQGFLFDALEIEHASGPDYSYQGYVSVAVYTVRLAGPGEPFIGFPEVEDAQLIDFLDNLQITPENPYVSVSNFDGENIVASTAAGATLYGLGGGLYGHVVVRTFADGSTIREIGPVVYRPLSN
jgi:hypothetical protein